jgi:His/Glu/Gln/Arg/opine family amino acid ABC transporter permease subunit
VGEFTLVLDYLPVLARGAVTTIVLSFFSVLFGTIVGLVVGLMRSSKRGWLRLPATGYIGLFRSIPILILLFFVYFGLPIVLGINMPSFPAAILALSLYCGAYMAEVVRTGVEAVGKGQWDASHALGMRYLGTLRYVVMPQALRVAVPPAVSVCIFTLKDSSLASVIGFLELTATGLAIRESGLGQGGVGVLLTVALIYFVLAYSLSFAGQRLERSIRI